MKRYLNILFFLSLGIGVSAGPAGWLKSDEYECGEWLELTATALSDHRFVGWSDGNTESTRRVEVTGEATYVALFEAKPKLALWPSSVGMDGEIKVVGLNPEEESTIQVYSAAGHMLGSYTVSDTPIYVLRAQGVSGCYTVRITSASQKAVLKYIVYAR